jgi:transcriptional regulator with XRE-family HTH domain
MHDMAEQASTAGIPTFEMRHRLSLALEASGVTAADMAVELGVSETTIRNYRAGRTTPNRSTLRVWALKCGVPLEWILTGEIDLRGPGEQGEPPTKWLGVGQVVDINDYRSEPASLPSAA